jgi:hypothetical protein
VNTEPIEPGVSWLLQSLARGIVDGLRRNKIAAGLAGLTALMLLLLAVNYQLDGLQDYRESILPRLLRLESGFLGSLQTAESASGDWRAYYFENAHRQVKDILRVARLDRPVGVAAKAKHRKFIQYYERLDSEFYAVVSELRVRDDMDYVRELRKKMDELKPIRDDWAAWALPKKSGG